MSNVVRSQRQALEQLTEIRPGRLSRQTVRHVEQAAGSSLVNATRMQGAAYVAHVALQSVGMLSAEEARLADSIPTSSPVHAEKVQRRLSIIVDNYTGVAAQAVAELGY